MKASLNFNKSELACKCGKCVQPKPDVKLLLLLELIRLKFGKPIIITSGYRCNSHNAKIGGAKNSRHMMADACDVVVQDVSPREVADFVREHLKAIGEGGLGVSPVFTHIDLKPAPYREWTY